MINRAAIAVDEPSNFLIQSLKNVPCGGLALDLACGKGRHTQYLAKMKFDVVGIDKDLNSLVVARARKYPAKRTVDFYCLKFEKSLPFEMKFDLVIIVHFVSKSLLKNVAKILKPGGHIIYETFSGNGQNWRELPMKGKSWKELKGYEILAIEERAVGPAAKNRVAVKLHARKPT